MAAPRLKAGLVVKTIIRRYDIVGLSAVVTRRGDADGGAILVKLNRLQHGCLVLSQARTPEGELVWLRATGAESVPEADADAYIARQAKYDPDLWVVEVEDPAGQLLLDGRVV